MKLLLLSDLHLSTEKPVSRIDDFNKAQWAKMEYVWSRAIQEDAAIIQAGDFCDSSRNWNLLTELSWFLGSKGVRVYAIRGQHDMYMHSPEAPSIMTVLSHWGRIDLIEGQEGGPELWITGVRFGDDPPPLTPKHHPHILVVHGAIADAPAFYGQEYQDARKYAERYKAYDLILCGDIHRHFCIQTKANTILNTGPMIRAEATEYNFVHQPCFYIWDTKTGKLKKEIIPHQPAEEVLTRKHLEESKETQAMMADFIERTRKTLSEGSPGVDIQANFERAMATTKLPDSTRELILEVIDATKVR